MKISSSYIFNTRNLQAKSQFLPSLSEPKTQESREYFPYSYLSFGAMHNVKQKKFDIDGAKEKLLKQLNEILEANRDKEELFAIYMRQFMKEKEQFIRKAEMLYLEMQEIDEHPYHSREYLSGKYEEFHKRHIQLEKEARKNRPFVLPKKYDEKVDYALLNAFKTAASEDNFNFEKVYQDYYKDLLTITDVHEIPKRYPKIKIPMPAHIVIADRINDCLTRDFYENLYDLMLEQDDEKVIEYCTDNIKKICVKNSKITDEEYDRVIKVGVLNIIHNFKKIYNNDSWNSIPEQRKNKTVQISDFDLKLLDVDYNEFALSVIRQMYLEKKNPSQIKYSDGKNIIPLSALQCTPYKFEKPSDKIKPFIRAAEDIETAKRDYDRFDDNQLRGRLNFFLNKDIASSDEFLDRFIEFDSCDLSTKDKENFKKFLRVLDSVLDGKSTEKEALKLLIEKDIRPHETAKKEAAEKVKLMEALKAEQQKGYELSSLKSKFDNLVNILYMNDMSNLAATCANMRPENLEEQSVEDANFVIDVINSNLSSSFVVKNENKIKSLISNRNTYNYYKKNAPDSAVLANAQKHATDYNGNVDKNRVGRYLHFSEILQNLPESLEYVSDKEIVQGILARVKDKEKQIEYLCKLDEYNCFDAKQKTQINEIMNLFDVKDNVDKYILKQIIENDYVKENTVATVNINDSGDTVDATISANAKQQILDKYKFPTCLTYMQAFEDGLNTFASDWGSSGIKKTGTNNRALGYKLEIKIMGHDDRLFSVDNNYYFDVFSDRGLH